MITEAVRKNFLPPENGLRKKNVVQVFVSGVLGIEVCEDWHDDSSARPLGFKARYGE